MEGHIYYLILFVLLIFGTLLISIYIHLLKIYRFKFLKFLTIHIILNYLIILLQVLRTYILFNVNQIFFRFIQISLLISTLLIIGMIYTYGRFAFSMYEEKISSFKKNLIYALVVVVSLVSIIGVSLFFSNRNVRIVSASEYVYFLAIIFISTFLVFDQRISSKITDRKVIKAFGLFYSILCIPFILHLRFPLPQSLYIYVGSQFILIIFPLFWFNKYYLKNHTLGISYFQDKAALNRIYDEKNITKREQEIIELILQGKSNREIEKEIFISIYTVKNHIQNIYSKLGVRSRTKLIQLILDYQQKNSL